MGLRNSYDMIMNKRIALSFLQDPSNCELIVYGLNSI
ncbi:hypothetical protein SLEP1_g44593 [Rubroshorea leprosula]|uniref:Uncharacterized protein n=1 Tax=Rubroshorea leprosula TaxID=152421 RepID=A0AAV5LGV9_9ROSI|nr:hypothetical protein SLEP1_g44593 [Rubroshorea leprosula]